VRQGATGDGSAVAEYFYMYNKEKQLGDEDDKVRKKTKFNRDYYIVIRGKERKEIFVDDDRDRCKEYATAEAGNRILNIEDFE